MATHKDVKAEGRETLSKKAGAWVLAAVVLAASTAPFNARVVSRPDERRAVAPEVSGRYAKLLKSNDTTAYLEHLGLSVEALRRGRVYCPVGDFDCPVTYLVPAGGLVVLTGCPLLVAHNAFFLAVFFLNGLSAFAFLKSLTRSTALALIGALAYQGCNFVLMCHYMGHMNNVQILWIPLVFLGLQRSLIKNSSWGWAALLGLAVGLQVLSSPYYTLFLAFAAVPAFVLAYASGALYERSLAARDLVGFALRMAFAAGLAGLTTGFYLMQRMGARPHLFELPTYRPYCLDHYLEVLDPSDPALFVGLPLFVLTVLALRQWWVNPRPLTTALAVAMLVSLVLMVVPLPGTPYWFYYQFCPLFKRLRVPLRFFPIFHLMLIALTVLYLDEGGRKLSRLRRSGLAGGLFCLLLGLNWLASPWVVNIDLTAALKQAIGQKTPVVTAAE